MAVLPDLVLGHFDPLFEDNRCHNLFTVLTVRHSVDLDIGDLRMGVEELLDLARIDVFTAADNHVLDSAGDLAIAVLIHDCQITGVQPLLRIDSLGGLLRHLVVAFHNQIAAGAEFTLLAGREGFACLDINNLYLNVRQRPTDRGDAQFNGIICSCLGDNRRRFGLAVSDGDLAGIHLADNLLHNLYRAVRAGHDAASEG